MKRWTLEAWCDHVAIAIVAVLAVASLGARLAMLAEAIAWIR